MEFYYSLHMYMKLFNKLASNCMSFISYDGPQPVIHMQLVILDLVLVYMQSE